MRDLLFFPIPTPSFLWWVDHCQQQHHITQPSSRMGDRLGRAEVRKLTGPEKVSLISERKWKKISKTSDAKVITHHYP